MEDRVGRQKIKDQASSDFTSVRSRDYIKKFFFGKSTNMYCDDPRVSLLSQDLYLSEDSEEDSQDQLSAEVSPLKDFKNDILTDEAVYENAPYSGSVTKNLSSSYLQTSVPSSTPSGRLDAPSDRLQDVVSAISRKERPLGELSKIRIHSCLFSDESPSSYADAACERSANLSNVDIVATLTKGRELKEVVNSSPPCVKSCCDLTLHDFTIKGHVNSKLGSKNKLGSRSEQSDHSRVTKVMSAGTAMFTRKRREPSLSDLTLQSKHAPFLYKSDNEQARGHVSKQLHKLNNRKEALHDISDKRKTEDFNEPDVRGGTYVGAFDFNYFDIVSLRKYKFNINKTFSVIKTALGMILTTFVLIFMGGMLSQANNYSNSYNIKGYTDVAITGGNTINSNQVICVYNDGFYKYWNCILLWLGVWTFLRIMTSEVRTGIKGGRIDLRNQKPTHSHRACKSSLIMKMTCMLLIYGFYFSGFTISLSLSLLLYVSFSSSFLWLLYISGEPVTTHRN